jgi:hypothetical protein
MFIFFVNLFRFGTPLMMEKLPGWGGEIQVGRLIWASLGMGWVSGHRVEMLRITSGRGKL